MIKFMVLILMIQYCFMDMKAIFHIVYVKMEELKLTKFLLKKKYFV